MAENFANLLPGDPAPWFRAVSTSNPRYVFDTAAGRWIVLYFAGSTGQPHHAAVEAELERRRARFDDDRIAFFGVTVDPIDQGRIAESLPGVRWFLDFDLNVSRLYGAVATDVAAGTEVGYRPHLVLLDPMLRVYAKAPATEAAAFFARLDDLSAPADFAGVALHAPVLILPRVFEPSFCRKLIELYETGEAADSGFMREVDGKTVPVIDHGFKKRSDHEIRDPQIIEGARARVRRRLVPEIAKAFNFQVTRMERHIVACYDGRDGGWFRPHRDNTTGGTAHRRFAVTINLNAEDYEGGDLMFPEFGNRLYRAPTGGAVVFGCGLLHTVRPVTKGRRYAYLPFLYDEAAARLREANNDKLDEAVGRYRA